jgi:hypothetical protein
MLNFIILNLFITIINGFVIDTNTTSATTVTSSEWSEKSIELDGNNIQESISRYFLAYSNYQSLIASLDS